MMPHILRKPVIGMAVWRSYTRVLPFDAETEFSGIPGC